jgi:hypothetical protein
VSEIRKFHIIADDDPLLQPSPVAVLKAQNARAAVVLPKMAAAVSALTLAFEDMVAKRRNDEYDRALDSYAALGRPMKQTREEFHAACTADDARKALAEKYES